MAMPSQNDVTALLDAVREGKGDHERLYAHVYDELHRIAHRHRARWSGNDTLNTTALVHEAYVKVSGGEGAYENRAHFLAVASRAMRQVLVTYAEAQRAQKRGGGVPDLPLDESLAGRDAALLTEAQADNVAALDARARTAGEGQPARRAHRGVPLLRRHDGRGDCRGARPVHGDGHARLARAARAWLYRRAPDRAPGVRPERRRLNAAAAGSAGALAPEPLPVISGADA